MDWRAMFSPRILNRGMNYYRDGAVEVLSKEDGYAMASVQGSEEYTVEISWNGNGVESMECDCPYAEEHDACKHMAAVLFALGDFEEEAKDPVGVDGESEKTLEELVAEVKEEELRLFVMDILQKDASLRNRFAAQFSKHTTSSMFRDLIDQVKDVTEKYADYGSYVDYENCGLYAQDIDAILDHNAEPMMKRGEYSLLFRLLTEIHTEIESYEFDDSYGEIGMLIDRIREHIHGLYAVDQDSLKKEMDSWFLTKYRNGFSSDEYGMIEYFVYNVICPKEIMEEWMYDLDRRLEDAEGTRDPKDSVFGGTAVEARIHCMRKLQYTEEEIKNWRKLYRRFRSVRMMELSEALGEGDYVEAERLLLESMTMDAGYPSFLEMNSEKLVALYEKTNDKKKLMDTLFTHIQRYIGHNLEYAQKLKELMSLQEWENIRLVLSKLMRNYEDACCFLKEEEMYEDLLQKIAEQDSVFLLQEYEDVLKERFPDEVIALYQRELERDVRTASKRSQYSGLVSILKRIASVEGGDLCAREIADAWRRNYKRRTALMDELRMAGF